MIYPLDPFARRFLECKRSVFATPASDPVYSSLVACLKRAEQDCRERGIDPSRLSLDTLEREETK